MGVGRRSEDGEINPPDAFLQLWCSSGTLPPVRKLRFSVPAHLGLLQADWLVDEYQKGWLLEISLSWASNSDLVKCFKVFWKQPQKELEDIYSSIYSMVILPLHSGRECYESSPQKKGVSPVSYSNLEHHCLTEIYESNT